MPYLEGCPLGDDVVLEESLQLGRFVMEFDDFGSLYVSVVEVGDRTTW